MRLMFPFVLAMLVSFCASAQKIDDGLWNAGRAFSITPLDDDSIILQKQLSLVQIYPGFSVVKSIYDIVNTRKQQGTSYREFHWQDTLTSPHRYFHRLNNLGSAGMKILAGQDTIRPKRMDGSPNVYGSSYVFGVEMAPGKLITITTYQLTPNNQAKLSGDETVKELNGFVFSFDKWKQQADRQVFLKLAGELSLNNLKGVYPATVTGTMDKLKWTPDTLNETLVIWYEGQAPDYKFEKKVLPKQHLLFEDINGFDLAFFDGTGFKPVDKTDFTTNTRSTVGTVLYFLMFTIPWIFLIWFIVYLLRKPKKKLHA
ncbi:MAG TPA: hypothetical protein VLA58_07930 [Chitinophagaceae bacterium]|nr:hypothetical protein [Chitinophagaceae bacterium]